MKIKIASNIEKPVAKALRGQIKQLFLNQLWSYERNGAYDLAKLFRDNNYPQGVVAKVTEYNESQQAEVIWEVQIVETAGSFRTIYHDAKYGLHFNAYAWERARW